MFTSPNHRNVLCLITKPTDSSESVCRVQHPTRHIY